ncbi:MAG: PadR family transcriptional regulator [Thermoleophilia bacterium]|jgi:DNA-binding PadR family transcriptional regulator
MTRIFNRGELKHALLSVLDSLGDGHGYAVMQELQRRVGREWRPSPGAIYPALVALEESGAVCASERDGLRVYRLTESGRRELETGDPAPHWHDYSRRADARRPQHTLGALLERFEVGLPRRAALTRDQADDIDARLTAVRRDISAILDQVEGGRRG